MTIKELKTKYYVYKAYNRDGNYRICSLSSHGRFPHKYLCSATKEGNKMGVLGYKLTSSLSEFEKQVDNYLMGLEFDSEYFNPDLRDNYKYEMYIHDYMCKLGFKNKRDSEYVYASKDIYGKNSFRIETSFSGISIGDEGKNISMLLWIDGYSWIETKLEKSLPKIKEGIDSMLKPLFVSESIKLLALSEEMSFVNIDLSKSDMENFTITDYKERLKQELIKMIDKL